ncbi:MAG: hypothetical protein JXA51_01365 [Dehalococcoidales bacterium]|nr:hypothetical protein [Dehalococcoidales bacterium]
MKKTGLISLLILLVMVLASLSLPVAMLAQDEEPAATDNATDNTTDTPPEPELISEDIPEPEPISEEEEEEEVEPDTITMSTEFPDLEAVATGSFDYNVKIEYRGKIDRVFDLNTTVPTGWDAYINPQYETKRIPSIAIPASEYVPTSKVIKVNVTPPTWPLAEPGDYIITLEAVSEDVVGTYDLTAIITAKYVLNAVPVNEVYNTKAKAGRDNIYSLEVANFGTDSMNNITFTSENPSGWEITFEPEKIDVLEIFEPQTVDVNIKPPPKTVAGDYMITLRVSGEQTNADKISVRVTVETPTIWGWVGVAIIIIVIIGLVVIFMRLGRR